MVGFGETVVNCINNSSITNVKVKNFGYNDVFVEHGTADELEHKYGLDKESILSNLYLHKND